MHCRENHHQKRWWDCWRMNSVPEFNTLPVTSWTAEMKLPKPWRRAMFQLHTCSSILSKSCQSCSSIKLTKPAYNQSHQPELPHGMFAASYTWRFALICQVKFGRVGEGEQRTLGKFSWCSSESWHQATAYPFADRSKELWSIWQGLTWLNWPDQVFILEDHVCQRSNLIHSQNILNRTFIIRKRICCSNIARTITWTGISSCRHGLLVVWFIDISLKLTVQRCRDKCSNECFASFLSVRCRSSAERRTDSIRWWLECMDEFELSFDSKTDGLS